MTFIESMEQRRLLAAHYYGFTSDAMSWEQAETEAVRLGGHLASITSQAEQNFINSTFLQNNQDFVFWIGLNDKAEEGKFVWSNGDALTYQHWKSGEPNNLWDEDYVSVNWSSVYRSSGTLGEWNDEPVNGVDGSVSIFSQGNPAPRWGIMEFTSRPAGYGGTLQTFDPGTGSTSPPPTKPVPTAPTDVIATDGRFEGQVRLSWSAARWATVYDVYRSPTRSVSAAVRIFTGLTQMSAIDRSAEAGQVYTYWVVARNSAGPGPRSIPETGSAAAAMRLGVTPIDTSLILTGSVAPSAGPAPLATKLIVRNRLELWLDIAGSAGGNATVAASRGGRGLWAATKVIGPLYETSYDATFRNATDSAAVTASIGPIAGTLNIINVLFPLSEATSFDAIGDVAEAFSKIPDMQDAYSRFRHFGEKPVRHAAGIAKDLYNIIAEPNKREIIEAGLAKLGLGMSDAQVSVYKKLNRVVDLVRKMASIAILNGQLLADEPIRTDFVVGRLR